MRLFTDQVAGNSLLNGPRRLYAFRLVRTHRLLASRNYRRNPHIRHGDGVTDRRVRIRPDVPPLLQLCLPTAAQPPLATNVPDRV